MPYTPAVLVKKILEDRRKINKIDQIRQISIVLFDLALADKEAAEVLLAEDNRFVKMIGNIISEEQLIKFCQIHSLELINKLIKFAGIEKVLADKMLKANIEKMLADNKNKIIVRPPKPDQNDPHPIQKKQDPQQYVFPPTPQDGRTHLAIQHNNLLIKRDEIDGIMLNNQFIPMVTRNTRDFNTKLCSVGASSSREIILLDPEDQLLQKSYEQLKTRLSAISDPLEILEAVKEITKECLPGKKPDEFIQQNLLQGKQIISLSEFIAQGHGVCRHHTLLNAYFLSRLVKDGHLTGEVIAHRQDFDKDGAHTWNIYRDKNGKVYSLDSLWNNVTCISDNPGAIDRLYRYKVETKIHKMHFLQKPEPKQLKQKLDRFKNQNEPQNPLPNSTRILIDKYKSIIEAQNFVVGHYVLFQGGKILTLDNSQKKRVPHRIYAIYEAIKNSNYSENAQQANELWDKIQQYASEAVKDPRPGRDGKTTEFYQAIINEPLPSSEPTSSPGMI